MKNNTVEYILPGFLNISRNEILINIYENYKNVVRENSKIHSFFGCFPSAIWNGGRLSFGEMSTIRYMKKIRDFHNNHDISIALTFTNKVLKETHLNDEYCNQILKVFNNGKNEVLVSYNKLEEYIRVNYPNYKINKSITATDNVGYDSNNYNLTVLAVRYNNDFDYINKIPLKDRGKIEVLCNEPCYDYCKYKYVHYEEINHIQLGDAPLFENRHKDYARCRYNISDDIGKFYFTNSKQKFYISPEDIVSKYLPLGISHMKINGREKNKYYGYENIVNYCIKPEYQNDILCFMLERFILEYEKENICQVRKKGIYIGEDQSYIGTKKTAS